MNASISSVSGPSPVVAIENDSRSRSTSTTQAANASATQSSKSADKSKKSQTLGDTVELSRSLDLTLGQDLLQSSIGRKIDAMFEEYGIDMDAYEGQDMSVEATSSRIFDFAVGMFDIYREQHKDLEEQDLKDKFESEIRGAVEKGFGEAMKILEGMNLDDSVLKTSRATFDALTKKFDDYFHPEKSDQGDVPMIDAEDAKKLASMNHVDLMA